MKIVILVFLVKIKIKELIEVALKNGYNDLVNATKNAYNIL